MRIGEAFPSKYLKAADLGGRKVEVVINSVEMTNIGDDQDKLLVYFQGKSKGLVLNVTNANMITEIAGTDETDNWTGTRITLYETKVDFQGRRVPAIRVDYPVAPAKVNGTRPLVTPTAPPSRAMQDQQPGQPQMDDDIPF